MYTSMYVCNIEVDLPAAGFRKDHISLHHRLVDIILASVECLEGNFKLIFGGSALGSVDNRRVFFLFTIAKCISTCFEL